MIEIIAAIAFFNADISPQELYCAAHAVYHEARGEPSEGKILVADVIKNRVKSKYYPNSICEVVYAPHAFSGITKAKDPNPNSVEWLESVKAAALVMSDAAADITQGATMYYNPYKIKHPSWDYDKIILGPMIGHHRLVYEKRCTITQTEED